MARTDQKTRGKNGRYLKLNALNKAKSVCGKVAGRLDKWIKSLDV